MPIDMILFCPACRYRHIDAPNPEEGWTNPPHRSHKCQACRAVWRPADVETNGVATIRTAGEADTMSWKAEPKPGMYEVCVDVSVHRSVAVSGDCRFDILADAAVRAMRLAIQTGVSHSIWLASSHRRMVTMTANKETNND